MSGQMKVNRWRLPLVVGSLVVAAAAIAVGVGALIAHDQAAKPSPAAFSAGSPSPAASDPHGRKACQLNAEAFDAERLGDDATLLRILNEGKQSEDFDIRFAAQMVYDQQVITNAAERDGSGDLGLLFAGHKASVQMQTTCVKAGLLR